MSSPTVSRGYPPHRRRHGSEHDTQREYDMTTTAEVVAQLRHELNQLETGDNVCLVARWTVEAAIDKLAAVGQDAAFYRCCALSGEVPKPGSEPSAQ